MRRRVKMRGRGGAGQLGVLVSQGHFYLLPARVEYTSTCSRQKFVLAASKLVNPKQ